MSEKTTDARECPRCHKQALGPWIEDNGRTLIGDRCGACNATWMLDVPQRTVAPPGDAVERVTDEELAEVARRAEIIGTPWWSHDAPDVRRLRELGLTLLPRLAAEVTTLRAEVERLKRENAVLAHDPARAPKFVPFAGGEIS